MVEGFEDLECYQAARKLRIAISELCKTFPSEEKYRLIDQIIRSSRSVTANIAEGYGRHHYQENLQYLRQSRGSLYETLEHLHTAFDEKYITSETHARLESEALLAIRILNGFIRYIANSAKKQP